MKANLQDQQTLLAIAEIDLALVKNQADRNKLLSDNKIQQANQRVYELSDLLIDQRNRVGELELELKRAERDLELVESRIAKDKQRLSATSSAKDAQGIEHELDSLNRRKLELEDAELNVMEILEQARNNLEEVNSQKLAAEKEFSDLSQALESQSKSLEAEQSSLKQKLQQFLSTLAPDLAQAYLKKASRSVAVGRLQGRDCGACRLSLTATNFEEINSLPADEIAECPNCQAYLVRA